MRISHIDIETCRLNPRAWVAQKIKPTRGQPRTGYDGATKLAIYKFHMTNSAPQAQDHLRELLSRLNLTNTIFGEKARLKLDSYIEWCSRESPVVSNLRLRLDYDLGYSWVLGGEVSRVDIDLDSGGYRGVLIGGRPTDWRRHLRIPLIQRALAVKLRRPEAEISVGFQNVDGTQLELIFSTQKILDEAEAKARELAQILSNEWRRQKGL